MELDLQDFINPEETDEGKGEGGKQQAAVAWTTPVVEIRRGMGLVVKIIDLLEQILSLKVSV